MNVVQRNAPATATTVSAAFALFVGDVVDAIPSDWPAFATSGAYLLAGFAAFGIGKIAQQWTTPFVLGPAEADEENRS